MRLVLENSNLFQGMELLGDHLCIFKHELMSTCSPEQASVSLCNYIFDIFYMQLSISLPP